MTDAVVRTIAFIDLAGFTALSEAHGDIGAADVARRLLHLTHGTLDRDVELVKSLGDAVMLVSASNGGLLDSVERLIGACRAEPGFPMLRGGIHRGPAIPVDRDYFGRAVNLAARLGGLAVSGQIQLTAEIAAAARTAGLPVTARGPMRLRGIPDPVDVFTWSLDVNETGIDPVCKIVGGHGKLPGYGQLGARWRS
ncbi:adenylate/guanylate cyclase domain-containing protein [Prauserella muralis]|uniref:Uncharacterized protein n=1 Tax=Prauserella muralis TaxID=588067 RepID=A0A2V4B1X7_9PSEU|nr:adenylate/guanylate cyclase domain-containing protein [Prauserella muralis]PXY28271.1 hypothetical protein BAY60_18345 [Prauserella muralis]TWE27451.1 adenylate cyclase [Prauserella muralis]